MATAASPIVRAIPEPEPVCACDEHEFYDSAISIVELRSEDWAVLHRVTESYWDMVLDADSSGRLKQDACPVHGCRWVNKFETTDADYNQARLGPGIELGQGILVTASPSFIVVVARTRSMLRVDYSPVAYGEKYSKVGHGWASRPFKVENLPCVSLPDDQFDRRALNLSL